MNLWTFNIAKNPNFRRGLPRALTIVQWVFTLALIEHINLLFSIPIDLNLYQDTNAEEISWERMQQSKKLLNRCIKQYQFNHLVLTTNLNGIGGLKQIIGWITIEEYPRIQREAPRFSKKRRRNYRNCSNSISEPSNNALMISPGVSRLVEANSWNNFFVSDCYSGIFHIRDWWWFNFRSISRQWQA